jgi:hypothetical protein
VSWPCSLRRSGVSVTPKSCQVSGDAFELMLSAGLELNVLCLRLGGTHRGTEGSHPTRPADLTRQRATPRQTVWRQSGRVERFASAGRRCLARGVWQTAR